MRQTNYIIRFLAIRCRSLYKIHEIILSKNYYKSNFPGEQFRAVCTIERNAMPQILHT